MASELSASQIAKILAADVHAGRLKAGEMFQSERELCLRFGVGRNVVREGMTILQGMNLADLSKGRRPRVAKPTLARAMEGVTEAAQFFFQDSEGEAHLEQARLFLETSMLRYAIAHATNAQMAKMVSAVKECEANLDNVDGFRRADAKFHRALAQVPGNPIFVALHDTFVERLMKNRPTPENFERRQGVSNKDHKDIINAMLAKDIEAAVEALNRHLTRNYESGFHQSLESQVAMIS